MPEPSRKAIVDALVGLGMRLDRDDQSPAGSVAELSYNDLRFRFVVHRGEAWLELQPYCSAQEWFDLGIIRSYMEDGYNLLTKEKIDDSVSFLSANLDRVFTCFKGVTCQSTVSELKALERQRSATIFGNNQANSGQN